MSETNLIGLRVSFPAEIRTDLNRHKTEQMTGEIVGVSGMITLIVRVGMKLYVADVRDVEIVELKASENVRRAEVNTMVDSAIRKACSP